MSAASNIKMGLKQQKIAARARVSVCCRALSVAKNICIVFGVPWLPWEVEGEDYRTSNSFCKYFYKKFFTSAQTICLMSSPA